MARHAGCGLHARVSCTRRATHMKVKLVKLPKAAGMEPVSTFSSMRLGQRGANTAPPHGRGSALVRRAAAHNRRAAARASHRRRPAHESAHSLLRAVRSPISSGILPVRKFSSRRRSVSPTKAPMPAGIMPPIAEPATSNLRHQKRGAGGVWLVSWGRWALGDACRVCSWSPDDAFARWTGSTPKRKWAEGHVQMRVD